MSLNEIISEAVELKPHERYLIIESLIKSLEAPNPEIELAWEEESKARLEAYRKGEMKTYSLEEVFGE